MDPELEAFLAFASREELCDLIRVMCEERAGIARLQTDYTEIITKKISASSWAASA